MKSFDFNLIYTKCYADFRSGLKFGCYQRTFWRYLICLAHSSVKAPHSHHLYGQLSIATIRQGIYTAVFLDEIFNTVRGTTYLMRDDGATAVNARS